MKIKALIVEDEELARNILKEYLKSFPDIDVAGEYADGFSALKAIREHNPDLVFLDVQMPRINGFEMLELLDDSPEIIFTTAFDQYAMRAFEINAVDYLLKPFPEGRFREAVEKAVNRISVHKQPGYGRLRSHIDMTSGIISRVVVKSRGEIRVIPVEKILFIEAQDDYVMIYTASGKYLKQKTMKYFDDHLSKEEFVRVHRSYIVRTDQIVKLEPYGKSSWIVSLGDSYKVPVSRSGYALLKEVLDI
ncbi:MAG: LytTR family DNA-binding domain-containing protein [Bacteroidales bacterium]